MFSALAGPDQQGRIQGALASVQGLVAIVAPLAGGWIFAIFAAQNAPVFLPGAPFLVAACAYMLAFAAVRGIPAPPARQPA
jgi:DHA1 family tetracycline resistance protein-like MFS transporter